MYMKENVNSLPLYINDDVSYSLYSADAILSNLVNDIDNIMLKDRDIKLIGRCWATHSQATINMFYANSLNKEETKQLVGKLFVKKPVLVSFWKGENIYTRLVTKKGKSHPRFAGDETVRGKLWCDNAVCNLIHTPDNFEEAHRELQLLIPQSDMKWYTAARNRTDKRGICNDVWSFMARINHSGVIMLSKIVNRMTFGELGYIVQQEIRDLLDVNTSNKMFDALKNILLHEIRTKEARLLVNSYFDGDKRNFASVISMSPLVVNEWERFVLMCGINDIEKWMA